MNFTAVAFFVFLPVALLLFYLVPNRFRYLVLLAASYFFYAFLNYWLIFLILATTLISYLGALGIAKSEKHKKAILALVLVSCLGLLFTFKYLDFALSGVKTFCSWCGLNVNIQPLNLILPVGISFYTFQTIGYVVDVYKGRIPAERHIGYYALFVSFFPQLVAGPIEEASKLIPELKKEHHWSLENFGEGLKFVVSGFLKKVVIADFLALYVNLIYNDLSAHGGFEILLATFLFGLVIYGDFSGYSDIALGVSKWMDIDLSHNFDRPYLSSSLKEFWRRWHISLNRFFTTYIYIPLGGSKQGKIRKYLCIFLVFFLSGLWHGASLHFVIWGVVCGMLLILEDLLSPLISRIPLPEIGRKVIGIALTYILINLCWVFFRASSLAEIGMAYSRIFASFASCFDASFFSVTNIVLLVLVIVTLPLCHYLPVLKRESENPYVFIGLYALLILVISLAYIHNLNAYGESSFIYFQF